MLEPILLEIGLTQNETKIYLTLLKIGESKTGEILKNSGINSGRIYEILSSLQKKGLVSYIEKSGVKYFHAANPKRILDYLEEKKQTIENQEKNYKEILPKILSTIETTEQTKIEIYTGLKGMKTAYSKELEYPKKTLYVFGVLRDAAYLKAVVNYIMAHGTERERKKIKIRKILSDDARPHRKNHEKTAQIKYLPYMSSVGINVIGSLSIIGIFSQEPIFITIEDENVAQSFKEQFSFLWKQAKK